MNNLNPSSHSCSTKQPNEFHQKQMIKRPLLSFLSIPSLFWLTAFTLIFPSQIVAIEKNTTNKNQSLVLFHVEVFPANEQPIQTVTLSENIYDYSHDAYLRDLRVTDSFGDALPFEISLPQQTSSKHQKKIALYPLYESRYLQQQTDNVSFKYDEKNRLSSMQSNTNTNTEVENQVVGYLLDLGEEFSNNNKSVSNMVIDFSLSDAAETGFLRFSLDQSYQLKNWTTISNNEVLAQLYDQDKKSQLNQIKIPLISSRYLRVNLNHNQPAFSILSARLEYTEKQRKRPLVWSKTQTVFFDPLEQAYLVELSPSVTYRKLQLELPKAPAVVRGKLYSRRNSQSTWRLVEEINFFSIRDGEQLILQNELSLPTIIARQLKIKLDYLVGAEKNLNVKLAWSPQELTFFANGNSPYEITVGKPNLKLIASQSGSGNKSSQNKALFSMMKHQIRNFGKEARLGKTWLQVYEKIPESPFSWQKIILWLVLIVGVLLMTWMAKRLLKQVD